MITIQDDDWDAKPLQVMEKYTEFGCRWKNGSDDRLVWFVDEATARRSQRYHSDAHRDATVVSRVVYLTEPEEVPSR